MLKYIYKTFLVSILCGSLLMLDMSYKSGTLYIGSNMAKAETVQTGGVDSKSLMTTLEMLAIGLMASRLIVYGKITLDIGVGMAGGAAFLAGEMVAQKKLKDAAKKIETELKRRKATGELTDEQRTSLLDLRQMYNAARDAAETKKTLQQAAAAAFLVAAGISYWYTAAELTALNTCMAAQPAFLTALGVANTACTGKCGPAAAACLAGCSAIMAACTEGEVEYKAMLANYKTLREVPSPSCTSLTKTQGSRTAKETSLKAGMPVKCTMEFLSAASIENAACAGISIADIVSEAGCEPTGMIAQIASFIPLLAMMGITDGGKGVMIGLAAAVIGFATGLAPVIDMNILTPTRRAIIWAVMGMGAFMASTATEKVIKDLEGQVAKIDNVINTINAQSQGLSIAGANGSNVKTKTLQNSGLAINDGSVNSEGLGIDGKLPCLTSTNSSKCTSLSSQLQNLPLPDGLPANLASGVQQAIAMGNGLNGSNTVSSGTMSAANNLASNAIKLKKEVDKIKKDVQKKLADSGSKINFDDEEKKARDMMLNNFNNEMAKKNISMGSLLASLGNTELNKVLAKDVSKDGKILNKKFDIPTFVPPVMPTPVVTKAGDLLKDEAKPVDAKEEAKATASIDEYELTNDINTDKSQSIFKVISERYEKSAFPRLFKRLNE